MNNKIKFNIGLKNNLPESNETNFGQFFITSDSNEIFISNDNKMNKINDIIEISANDFDNNIGVFNNKFYLESDNNKVYYVNNNGDKLNIFAEKIISPKDNTVIIFVPADVTSVNINGSNNTVTNGKVEVSTASMTYFDVNSSQINEIYFGNNSTITKVLAYNNNLKKLNLSNLSAIKKIHIHDNPMCDDEESMRNMIKTLPDRNGTNLGSILTSNQDVRKLVELDAIDKEWYFGSTLQYNTTEKNKMNYYITAEDSGILDIWESAEYGDGITIFLIDSGFSPDLKNINYDNVITNYNCQGIEKADNWNAYVPTNVPSNSTPAKHGNLNLSIMAGNGVGLYGICPKVKLILSRLSDDNGWGDDRYTSVLMDQLLAHVDEIDCIAMPTSDIPLKPILNKIAETLTNVTNPSIISENGANIFTSGGNYGDQDKNIDDGFRIGALKGSLTIGCATTSGTMQNWTGYNKSLDMMYYGMSIKGEIKSNNYATLNGTSQSSVLMTGCSALVKNLLKKKLRREPNSEEIREFLRKHTKGRGSGNKSQIGNGLFGFNNYNSNPETIWKIVDGEWREI